MLEILGARVRRNELARALAGPAGRRYQSHTAVPAGSSPQLTSPVDVRSGPIDAGGNQDDHRNVLADAVPGQ